MLRSKQAGNKVVCGCPKLALIVTCICLLRPLYFRRSPGGQGECGIQCLVALIMAVITNNSLGISRLCVSL